MRESKNRKHEKVRLGKANKTYRKNNSLTSRSTKNRHARNIMEALSIPYVIIDGIVYTYRVLIL